MSERKACLCKVMNLTTAPHTDPACPHYKYFRPNPHFFEPRTKDGVTDCEHVPAGLCNDCMADLDTLHVRPQPTPPKPMPISGPKPHFHRNRLGVLEACYHRVTKRGWATGLVLWTVSFPFEHALWMHAPGFSSISHWLGL